MREHVYSLNELLLMKETKDLQMLARLYKLRGYSAYKKEELIQKVEEIIKKEFIQYLATLGEKDLELFKHLAEEPLLADGRLGRAALFISLGWASLVENAEEKYLVIATDIITLHNHILAMPEFKELHEHRQDFKTYRNGLTNLYGAVELHWVTYLYNRDYDRNVNFAIVLEDLNYINQIYGGCKLIGDYLVHGSLYCEGEEDFHDLRKAVFEKDYFEPSRVLIRLMSQEGYYEDLEVLTKLKNYIRENFTRNEDFIEEAILTMVINIRVQSKVGLDLIEDIMQQWYRLGINVQNMNQLQEVTLMITQAIKNTRSWYNKGYTAEELTKAKFPELYTKEIPKVNNIKVGRNDPCPCGSGLKYKKCCYA